MFSNFIYFIIALLVITLYQPVEQPPLSFSKALLLFSLATLSFSTFTRIQYQRLRRRVDWTSRAVLDNRFTTMVTRHSILSLILFAVVIWWLHLPSYLQKISIFETLPTLKELLLLLIFVMFLTIVWYQAFDAYQEIYQTDISRGTYVYSNIAFSVPILIPWTLLSGLTDLITLLPFELPKRILETTLGQISYFLIFLVAAAVFAPLLIQHFWRCRPLENGSYRERIEHLCQRAGIRYADIVYWPIFGGRMITAGVMGLVSRFRYIMVTEALLKILRPDEIDQVIAHEIGHVKRKHLLLYLMFFIGFMLISYSFYPISILLLYTEGPFFSITSSLNLNPIKILPSLYAILLVIGIIIYFRFIFGYFMRNFERQADLFVFRLFPSVQPLINTFDKIVASSGQPADKPNWHHFSIQQRIDYLRRCESESSWINRHDKKVRRGIIIYLIAFFVLAFGVFHLNLAVNSKAGNQLIVSDLQSYLSKKVVKEKQDALLYMYVASVHYEQGDLQQAVQAYRAALELDDRNADVLNNLAWIYASEDTAFYAPELALEMAEKAIELKKAPHIWDTYALALFQNGYLEEAIEAEKKALAMEPDEPEIYQQQLQRFQSVFENN
jgi:Zn-dependent protease with chaperone function